jgi:ribosomal subunit interface protein
MINKTLNIKATHIDLTDEIKNYVESKTNTLMKFIDATEQDVAKFNVEVGKTNTAQHTGNIFRAEINLNAHGQTYRTESTTDHIHSAIDEATHEMEREVKKHKDKRKTLFRRGAEKIKNILRGSN